MTPSEKLYCKRCKKQKAASSFSNDASRPTGKFPWCKPCQIAYQKATAWQDEGSEPTGRLCPVCDTPLRGHVNRRYCSESCKIKADKIRKRYGLTIRDYRRLVEANEGKCPICKRTVRTTWQIDHNHQTGRVTGVVCVRCNVGALAMTYHDVEFVRSLLAYLENTPAQRLGVESVVRIENISKSNLHKVWRHQGFGKKVS